ANDFHEDDYLYINQGKGKFREELRSRIGHTSKFSMGGDAADINNDLSPDLITMDMKPFREEILKTAEPPEPYDIFQLKKSFGYYNQYPRNTLQLNQEGEYFVEVAQLMGVDATDWSWSALFWDADLDGYQDLFITNGILRRPNDMDYLKFRSDPKVVRRLNGIPSKEDLAFIEKMPSVNLPNQAFQNLGGKGFASKGEEWGFSAPHFSNGAAYADLDNDGDLDWIVNNIDEPASIYQNTTRESTGNSFLTIHLRNSSNNTFGLGAKVYVRDDNGYQYRYLSPSRGFQSAVSHALHFGLGKSDSVDITIIWPDGELPIRKISKVAANQQLWISREAGEPLASTSLDKNKSASPFRRMEDFDAFVHQENDYVDFNVEPLIPHMLSSEGPDIAVADVNGDDLDDYYICGAAGQGGQLFIQRRNGKFSTSQNLWSDFAGQEEVACEFLDVEGDGDQDLLIACGGNQFREGSPYNQERLYLNDGNGTFTLVPNRLPEINTSSSTLAVADYDKDGDVDIFLGTRSVAGSYGLSPRSYLLKNDGKGFFSSEEDVPFGEAGMITDASWGDMDGNGYLDLLLVGEWMPIQIWYNDGQEFDLRENELLNQKGWWSTVEINDWDGDGDMDLIAGNLGLNTSMKASHNEPCHLYVGDFDQNGQTDPILCYFRDGVSYPMASKDELEKQMPFIRKDFPSYQEFAGSTIGDLIPSDRLESAIVLETTTFAHIYAEQLNDGSFRITELPWESQLSSVNAIASVDLSGDGKKEVILGGNQFGFAPNLGRMDAGRGWIIQYDSISKEWEMLPINSGLMLPAEVRSLNVTHNTSKEGQFILLVGNNNDKIQFFVGQ
ncbi:MAG: FG-GAP-like repeat-containing protein, partial [Bacteroidota bacterium]